ncbi:MAG: hypothetical protein GC152_03760 [Alphaproteobacteria bacterium]|nr:hypothetical protein [Alphaproteobacteria bacterium]
MAQSRTSRPPAKPPQRKQGRCLGIGGKGDGVIAFDDGARAHAPYTAPDDLGMFDIVDDRATVVELLAEGPDRIQPPCVHYGVCGGCQLQHLTPAFQRNWKRDRVIEALSRVDLASIIVADAVETPTAARRRAIFTVDKSRRRTVVGFNERRSSRIAEVAGCLVMRPDLRDALPDVRRLANAVPTGAFDLAATACRNGIDVDIRSRKLRRPDAQQYDALFEAAVASPFIRVSLNGEPMLTRSAPAVEFGSAVVSPPPGAFLQASLEGETAISKLALGPLAGAKRVADLYAGCGTFALRLACEGAEVAAFDIAGPSIDALERAAREARAAGVIRRPLRTEARDLDERPLHPDELSGFEAVVIDPPRAGALGQMERLARSSVRTVASVSCNPATFARDARALVEGGFSIETVTPIDQFVHSAHLEVVGVFQRR